MKNRKNSKKVNAIALAAVTFGIPMAGYGAYGALSRWDRIYIGHSIWALAAALAFVLVSLTFGFGRRRAR